MHGAEGAEGQPRSPLFTGPAAGGDRVAPDALPVDWPAAKPAHRRSWGSVASLGPGQGSQQAVARVEGKQHAPSQPGDPAPGIG
jgi:hypothetical protein